MPLLNAGLLVWKPNSVLPQKRYTDGEIDGAICRERGLRPRKGRWTEWEKKRLNTNFIDFVHEHEEEIGYLREFAMTSENNSRAWEV